MNEFRTFIRIGLLTAAMWLAFETAAMGHELATEIASMVFDAPRPGIPHLYHRR